MTKSEAGMRPLGEPEEMMAVGTQENKVRRLQNGPNANIKLRHSRSMPWARVLPAVSLAIYVALMVLARPNEVEGLDIDRFALSLPERIAIALNSPIIPFAWNLSFLVDYPPWWVEWCFGAIPVLLLWYSIGWWLDRYELPRWLNSASWWNTRLTVVGLLVATLIVVFANWLRSSVGLSADWALDIVAALVVWPIVVSIIVIQTFKGRKRRAESDGAERGRSPK